MRLEPILNLLLQRVPQGARFDRVLVRCDLVCVIVARQIDITDAAKTIQGAEVVVGE